MVSYSKRLVALMGTTCLGVAAMPDQAAADLVFGFERLSPQPPEDIYLVDPETGDRVLVCTFDPNVNGNANVNSPNGLAYDQDNNRLYFSVTTAGQPSQLYFCEPDATSPDQTATHAGELDGESAGAAWTTDDEYVYIENQTDDAKTVTFNADGTIASEGSFAANLLGGSTFLRFGDLAQACDGGDIFGSSISGGFGPAFFSFPENGPFNEISTANGTGLQLAFAADGTLYGHSTATGEFFTVDPDGIDPPSLLVDTAAEYTDLGEVCDPILRKTLASFDGVSLPAEEIPIVVEIKQDGATSYDFDITYTGTTPVLIVDTVNAEWVVIDVAGNGNPVGEGEQSDNNGPPAGLVDVFKAGGENSATKIEWTPEVSLLSSTINVVAETRLSPGSRRGPDKYAPTSCGLLEINPGAVAFEIDENGELVLVEGEPVIVAGPTEPLQLIALGDEDDPEAFPPYEDYPLDGTGDFDEDNLTDAEEVFEIGTDPCLQDTDGDTFNDDVDQCPLEGDQGDGVDDTGCPVLNEE